MRSVALQGGKVLLMTMGAADDDGVDASIRITIIIGIIVIAAMIITIIIVAVVAVIS